MTVYVCVCVCVGRARVLACVRACVFPILILSLPLLFEWIVDERERIIYSCSFVVGKVGDSGRRTDGQTGEERRNTTLIDTQNQAFNNPLFRFMYLFYSSYHAFPSHVFSVKLFCVFIFTSLGRFLSLFFFSTYHARYRYHALLTILLHNYLFLYSCIVLQ